MQNKQGKMKAVAPKQSGKKQPSQGTSTPPKKDRSRDGKAKSNKGVCTKQTSPSSEDRKDAVAASQPRKLDRPKWRKKKSKIAQEMESEMEQKGDLPEPRSNVEIQRLRSKEADSNPPPSSSEDEADYKDYVAIDIPEDTYGADDAETSVIVEIPDGEGGWTEQRENNGSITCDIEEYQKMVNLIRDHELVEIAQEAKVVNFKIASEYVQRHVRAAEVIHKGNWDKINASILNKTPLWLKKLTFDDMDHYAVAEDAIRSVYVTPSPLIRWRDRVHRFWFEKWTHLVRHLWANPLLSFLLFFLVTTLFLWSVFETRQFFTTVALLSVLVWVSYRLFQDLRGLQYSLLDAPDKIDVCCEHLTEIEGIEYHGKITPPLVHACTERSYSVGFTIAYDHLSVYRSCSHNEMVALMTRQMTVPIGEAEIRKQCYKAAYQALRGVLKLLKSADDLSVWVETYMAHLKPGKRKMMIKAVTENISLADVNARTQMFIKRETAGQKAANKEHPRAINMYSDEMLAEVAPEYYCWQKHNTKMVWGTAEDCIQQKVVYPGGLRADELGEIASYFEAMGWHAYMGDYSRYDGHQEEEAIAEELEFYKDYLGADTLHFLDQTNKTKGRTRNRVRYEYKGKRNSGGINTTFGNTISGMAIYSGVCTTLGLDMSKQLLMQFGDDLIIFSESEIDVAAYCAEVAKFGHKLEMSHITPDDYDHLEFCSQYFWDIGTTRCLGPKPGKVLTKTFCSTITYSDDELAEYMRGIAAGFKHYHWIPILGAFCEGLLSVPGKVATYKDPNPYKIQLTREIDVDTSAVERHFSLLYGLDPGEINSRVRALAPFCVRKQVSDEELSHVAFVDGALLDSSLAN